MIFKIYLKKLINIESFFIKKYIFFDPDIQYKSCLFKYKFQFFFAQTKIIY